MGDLLKELFVRYGLFGLILAAAFGVAVAITVHTNAAPGRVDLLFGLAGYDKLGTPDAALLSCEEKLDAARELGVLIAHLESVGTSIQASSIELSEIDRKIKSNVRILDSDPGRIVQLHDWQAEHARVERDREQLIREQGFAQALLQAAQEGLCAP